MFFFVGKTGFRQRVQCVLCVDVFDSGVKMQGAEVAFLLTLFLAAVVAQDTRRLSGQIATKIEVKLKN